VVGMTVTVERARDNADLLGDALDRAGDTREACGGVIAVVSASEVSLSISAGKGGNGRSIGAVEGIGAVERIRIAEGGSMESDVRATSGMLIFTGKGKDGSSGRFKLSESCSSEMVDCLMLLRRSLGACVGEGGTVGGVKRLRVAKLDS
jgi:hypothetical protein